MKKMVNKLLNKCEICKGIFGSHDLYEHAFTEWKSLAEIYSNDVEKYSYLVPRLNALDRYMENDFLSRLLFTSESDKDKIRGVGQINTQ